MSHDAPVSSHLLAISVSGRRAVVVGVRVVAVVVPVIMVPAIMVAVIVVAVVGLRSGEPVGADLSVGVAVVVTGRELKNLGPGRASQK